jgi:hypothetical protein
LCEEAGKSNGILQFIPAMRKLLVCLSKICTGKKTLDTRLKATDTNVRPFRDHGLDKASVSRDLIAKVGASLKPSEVRDHGMGFIYILHSKHPCHWAELKIGFSKYYPEHRLHELGRCLTDPEVVAYSPFFHTPSASSLPFTLSLYPGAKPNFAGNANAPTGSGSPYLSTRSRDSLVPMDVAATV